MVSVSEFAAPVAPVDDIVGPPAPARVADVSPLAEGAASPAFTSFLLHADAAARGDVERGTFLRAQDALGLGLLEPSLVDDDSWASASLAPRKR